MHLRAQKWNESLGVFLQSLCRLAPLWGLFCDGFGRLRLMAIEELVLMAHL